ncbi:MAG: LysR substrate-binding domain-containing protein [Rhodothermales bacterium]
MNADLSIDQLRTFVTVADVGSYTRAARQLYRTQPALSLQVKRLEEQLGTQLFQRHGRRTQVTEAGDTLLRYARRILDLNEQAVAKLSVVQAEGTVRIGILEEVALGPLLDLLTKFGRLCTKIRLMLEVSTSWTLAEQIERNTLCLAVANTSFGKGRIVPLWEEPYVWVCNQTFDIAAHASLPLVIDPYPCPCPIGAEAMLALDAMERPWHAVFSSYSLTAMLAAIRAGLGVGLIARGAVTPDLRVLGHAEGLPDVGTVAIGLYRSSDATSEASGILFDFLKQHLQQAEWPIR